ncbi:hypothetical protein ACJIZ3_010229 [Penstemon smallii]|uniref:Transmembrane protein n=1 Tax=Penstemon smallii TaxID=265156 RepID=A0ABD3TG41_9LAMI
MEISGWGSIGSAMSVMVAHQGTLKMFGYGGGCAIIVDWWDLAVPNFICSLHNFLRFLFSLRTKNRKKEKKKKKIMGGEEEEDDELEEELENLFDRLLSFFFSDNWEKNHY